MSLGEKIVFEGGGIWSLFIQNRFDYLAEAFSLFGDTSNYKKLEGDPVGLYKENLTHY